MAERSSMRLALRLAALALALAAAAPAWANAVGGMRVIGDSERTRFVVDLERSPEYAVRRLADPYRIVIDLPDVAFPEPARPGAGRGLVTEYRYGLIGPGRGRIVLDLASPAEIVNSFILEPVAPEPARLVIDLAPISADAFAESLRQGPPAAADPPAPPPRSVVASTRPVVVIDPGHGGIDSGAVADGLLEKELTLAFAVELARQLREGGNVEPVLTRDADVFVSLADRVDVARRHRAALFVSVHADTVRQAYVRGATVYTLSEDASDALAAALAARENRADTLAGLSLEDQPDDVANILFDLTMRETRNLATGFAKTLVDDMGEVFHLNANPWRRAAFRVLKAPEIPSVLLELGYLSNPEDQALFRSEGWPQREAETVADAVQRFLAATIAAGP